MLSEYPRKAVYTKRTFDLLDLDSKYISPSYTRDYPFVVEMGEGREVLDADGNWYLDFGAGIATTSTGHCHPSVVEAIKNQADMLIHMSGTDFFYEPQIKLAEKLAELAGSRFSGSPDGKPMAMSFFGNSGAEAVEAAMKLARYATGRPGFIAFTGAFHGRTMGALSLTGSKAIQREGYLPLQPVAHVPYPNCANCIFEHPSSDSLEQINYCKDHGSRCLDYIQTEVLDRGIMPPEDCAAIFMEPIQGEGGYIVPPDFWYNDIAAFAQNNDILIVCDEVQAGMGRTGRWFAHQNWDHTDFEPDIITCAKGIASGMPLGVMLADPNLMKKWPAGSHASTFGGNPVCCAAALATIEVIETEALMANAEKQGQWTTILLSFLCDSYHMANNPRGLGLMQAVDILGENKKGSYRDQVLMRCFEKGLILLGCGKDGIRFCPALNVTKEEIETCICILEESIKEIT